MGLFGNKKPEFGPPVFINMKLAKEQLPADVDEQIRAQGALMLQPKELSQWAISTLFIEGNESIVILPQDAGPNSYKVKKTISQIQIPVELLDALTGAGDPLGLVYEFDTWERTLLRALEFDDGKSKVGFLGFLMDEMGAKEMDFPALIVPDYSGKLGAPGEHFNWYVILHPKPYNGLDYVVFGECPPLAQPVYGGVDLALIDSGKIFNQGKAIPGLVKVFDTEEGIRTRYYLPREVVEATGWWADEVEGIPSSLPHNG